MVKRRSQVPVTPTPRARRTTARRAKVAERWLVLRVVLHSQADVDSSDGPGRDLLMRTSHSFAELAAAIDRAFARWDRSHLHEFRFADGRRIGKADTDEVGDREDELDERAETLGMADLKVGASFEYVFDLGTGWEHVCTVLQADVDPNTVYGGPPAEIVPIFGWGSIPDQYGRATPEGEDDDLA